MDIASPIGLATPGNRLRATQQRSRLADAEATDVLQQARFDKPFNSFYLPSSYPAAEFTKLPESRLNIRT